MVISFIEKEPFTKFSGLHEIEIVKIVRKGHSRNIHPTKICTYTVASQTRRSAAIIMWKEFAAGPHPYTDRDINDNFI